MKKRLLLLSLAVVALLASSCTSDHYYANSFIRKFDHTNKNALEKIYVALPSELIHTNSSLNDVPGFAYMSESQQDSVIASLTHILDKIDDSIFLAEFNNAFLFTLSRTRLPIVIVDNASKLPPADDNHFTVAVAQLEAEEYVTPGQSEFTTKNGAYYSYDYTLSHFSLNAWFLLDARDSNAVVSFKNAEISEDFHGTVTSLKDGKATLRTHFDRIDVNDAYRVARRLGSSCAILYYEKILSEYVCRTKGTNDTYFIYDPGCNCIETSLPYAEGIKTSFETLP